MIYEVMDETEFQQMRKLKETEITPRRISVVIPFFNNWDLTHQRLMDLWKHVNPYEIILIDDASTETKIDSSVAWWQKEVKLPIRYVKNGKNLGFGKSMNKGIWLSEGEVVVLLSNDVTVSGDFTIPILSKIDNNVLIGNTLYEYDTGWNKFVIKGKVKIFPYLGGYFLAAFRDSFIELGGFDDRYGKFDYEDVDLSTRAVYMGYELVPLNSGHLTHLSGQTVRKNFPDREKYTNENKKKFYEKWKKLYEDTSKFPNNK